MTHHHRWVLHASNFRLQIQLKIHIDRHLAFTHSLRFSQFVTDTDGFSISQVHVSVSSRRTTRFCAALTLSSQTTTTNRKTTSTGRERGDGIYTCFFLVRIRTIRVRCCIWRMYCLCDNLGSNVLLPCACILGSCSFRNVFLDLARFGICEATIF